MYFIGLNVHRISRRNLFLYFSNLVHKLHMVIPYFLFCFIGAYVCFAVTSIAQFVPFFLWLGFQQVSGFIHKNQLNVYLLLRKVSNSHQLRLQHLQNALKLMSLIFECLPCALYFICSLELALSTSKHSSISFFMFCGGEKKLNHKL